MRSLFSETIVLVWGGVGAFCGWQVYQGNPRFYSTVLMPHVHYLFDSENAHKLAVKMMALRLVPKSKVENDLILESSVFGKTLKNPIGIAAGFDKHAEAITGLEKIGFGFVEIGSVTPNPQSGNEKPRVFRLAEDHAVINRYGFNSCGHDKVAERLEKYKAEQPSSIVLGVNLGKNKTSTSAVDDYVNGVKSLGIFADYIVINVSSPNTVGLRKLQERENLENICKSVIDARNKLTHKPPVLVKIAPDLNEDGKREIASVILKNKIDGLIVCNTTIQRPESLQSKYKNETGGLSGEPLRLPSTQLIADMYTYTNGKIPIIGVGGIRNGLDAYEKIRAGASLVQVYTALVYEGPPLVDTIKKQLTFLLKRDQFSNISEAVGADHR